MTAQPQYLDVEGARIAYYHHTGKSPVGVMFLGGFMSNMEGGKALALDAFCRDTDISFTRFDYGGHGQSSGLFEEGSIGLWQSHAQAVFDQVTKGPQVLVGSSMGGWMMLLLGLARRERVGGLVGIASAPDFTEKLIWEDFSPAQQAEMRETGKVMIRNCVPGESDYPITRLLIEEGRRHLLTHKPIPLRCPVHLLHGMLDPDVPYTLSLQLADMLERNDVEVTLVKNGDHRMSTPNNLRLLCDAVKAMVLRAEKELALS